jgi:hypothetical protein
MVRCIANIVLALAIAQTLLGQEPQLNVKKEPAGANDALVIEVTGAPDGISNSIIWEFRGDGHFSDTTVDKKEVSFIPTKANDVVVILCTVKLGNGQQKLLSKAVHVPDKQAAATAPPAPAPPAAQQPRPVPAQQPVIAVRTLSGDAVPIFRLFDPNEALVEATGWMGDAVPDDKGNHPASLFGSRNCPYTQNGQNAGCWLLKYKIDDKGKGWAGFAWQIRPQEASDNWGQYPGKNLSSRHFRSVAVFARVEPDGFPNPTLQFKAGGNVDPKYLPKKASFLTASPPAEIPVEGKWFCLDLSKEDMSYVVSPFTVVVSNLQNPLGADINVLLNAIHFSTRSCSDIKNY